MPWHAQYGRWDFLGDTGGVHQIGWSPHCFLFIYLHLRNKKVHLSSSSTTNRTTSSSHWNSKIVYWKPTVTSLKNSFFALVDLTMSNLDYPACLLDCSRPALWSEWKFLFVSLFILFLFIYFFFVLGWRFACVRLLALHCMFHNEYFRFPTPFRDQLNRLYFPLSAVHRVLDLKISRAFRSSLLLEVSWMEIYSEIYDRPPAAESYKSFYLINKCTKNVWLQGWLHFGCCGLSASVICTCSGTLDYRNIPELISSLRVSCNHRIILATNSIAGFWLT